MQMSTVIERVEAELKGNSKVVAICVAENATGEFTGGVLHSKPHPRPEGGLEMIYHSFYLGATTEGWNASLGNGSYGAAVGNVAVIGQYRTEAAFTADVVAMAATLAS